MQASRTSAWKVHGPDANGAYGGLRGINDYYGHIIATVAGKTASEAAIRFHETKSICYGPAPDRPVHYLSEGASLTQSNTWLPLTRGPPT